MHNKLIQFPNKDCTSSARSDRCLVTYESSSQSLSITCHTYVQRSLIHCIMCQFGLMILLGRVRYTACSRQMWLARSIFPELHTGQLNLDLRKKFLGKLPNKYFSKSRGKARNVWNRWEIVMKLREIFWRNIFEWILQNNGLKTIQNQTVPARSYVWRV